MRASAVACSIDHRAAYRVMTAVAVAARSVVTRARRERLQVTLADRVFTAGP